MKDKMTILSVVSIVLMVIFIMFFMQGCSTKTIVKKEVVTKKVYVKRPCPKLKVFDYNKTITLNAYNKGNKICVEEWKTCIPKQEMIKLVAHIKMLKEVNSKYRKEIEDYNKEFTNKEIK